MAKINAGKLKEMARELKNEDKPQSSVKKLGDAIKTEAKKKISASDGKLSGRKN